jgi:hypothetical protein
MKNKLMVILLSGIFVGGCATNTADSYRNTPTAQLCMDYLTLPSYNINQEARAQALANRGENCSSYTGVARTRIEANSAMQNSLNALQQQGVQQQITPQQGTRTYIRNGKIITCTTIGTITNCI